MPSAGSQVRPTSSSATQAAPVYGSAQQSSGSSHRSSHRVLRVSISVWSCAYKRSCTWPSRTSIRDPPPCLQLNQSLQTLTEPAPATAVRRYGDQRDRLDLTNPESLRLWGVHLESLQQLYLVLRFKQLLQRPALSRHAQGNLLKLLHLRRYRDQRDRPDLTNPDSLQLYLESRFEQLRVACDMELWQEAYRSVEDIQGLIAIGKSKPKPQMQCTYYARLTRIFTVSDSQLFNGCVQRAGMTIDGHQAFASSWCTRAGCCSQCSPAG